MIAVLATAFTTLSILVPLAVAAHHRTLEEMSDIIFAQNSRCYADIATKDSSHKWEEATKLPGQVGEGNSQQDGNDESDGQTDGRSHQIASRSDVNFITQPQVRNYSDIRENDKSDNGTNSCSSHNPGGR